VLGAQAAPRFEAVSIRPNTSGDGRTSLGLRGRTYAGTNTPIWMVLTSAFELGFQTERVVGAPDWTKAERFDLIATLPEGTGRAQLSEMLQAMLADRFHLAAHRETRDAPIYALVVARADGRLGPRLRPSTIDCEARRAAGAAVPTAADGKDPLCKSQIDSAIMGRGQRISELARMLAPFAERTVIDRTRLTGAFDFDLTLPAQNAGKRPGEASVASANDPAGGIFTVLQDELGLKLEPARAPLEFVVVDRIARPTAD
jgi:uncharacterized protein (TIGR03435 family)